MTRDHKARAVWRFLSWQIVSRYTVDSIPVRFVNNSKLAVRRGMRGATGNVYVGLADCNEMGFLLHFLRRGDIFADVGANVGVYTVLASAAIGAKTIAIEPVPQTYDHLLENVRLNKVDQLVQAYKVGVDEHEGKLYFTKNLDSVNHVVNSLEEVVDDVIEIDVQPLDDILKDNIPLVMKVDVEGYEKKVLSGAAGILGDKHLHAVIIEVNGSGRRYGIDDSEVTGILSAYGFMPCQYDPFRRVLSDRKKGDGDISDNVIYIRNKEFVYSRLAEAPPFKVHNHLI